MSLTERTKQGIVKKIISLINNAADNGYTEIDLNDYDIAISEDIIDDIKARLKAFTHGIKSRL